MTTGVSRSDSGSVMLLILGLVVLSALLITVVVDVSNLYLARRDVLAAADGAALAGAQAIDEPAVYRNGATGTLPLDPAQVRRSVDEYLSQVATESNLTNLQWRVVTTGTRVRVLVQGVARLPFINSVTPDAAVGVSVSASSTAQSATVP